VTADVSRQRLITTLARLEAVQAGEPNPVIDGLLRAGGQPTLAEGTGRVKFDPARSVGDTWLFTVLRQELEFDKAFRRMFRRAHQKKTLVMDHRAPFYSTRCGRLNGQGEGVRDDAACGALSKDRTS